MSPPESDYPDEITIDGYNFRLVAQKRGVDKGGIMHYRMEYEDGDPVIVATAEYKRNEVSLVFDSRLGRVAFDFKLREWH